MPWLAWCGTTGERKSQARKAYNTAGHAAPHLPEASNAACSATLTAEEQGELRAQALLGFQPNQPCDGAAAKRKGNNTGSMRGWDKASWDDWCTPLIMARLVWSAAMSNMV